MNKMTRHVTHAALIAAVYAAVSCFQNLLLPGSASWVIQFRIAEALCVLALFTPAAISGLTVGCMLFNLCFAYALPLDTLIGSFATLLSAWGMYLTRRIAVKGYPLVAMLLPALFNGLIIGWELSIFIAGNAGSFWAFAANVAIGEAAVLLSLGTALFYGMKIRHLDTRLFG